MVGLATYSIPPPQDLRTVTEAKHQVLHVRQNRLEKRKWGLLRLVHPSWSVERASPGGSSDGCLQSLRVSCLPVPAAHYQVLRHVLATEHRVFGAERVAKGTDRPLNSVIGLGLNHLRNFLERHFSRGGSRRRGTPLFLTAEELGSTKSIRFTRRATPGLVSKSWRSRISYPISA
jgi:hypothetical protein